MKPQTIYEIQHRSDQGMHWASYALYTTRKKAYDAAEAAFGKGNTCSCGACRTRQYVIVERGVL